MKKMERLKLDARARSTSVSATHLNIVGGNAAPRSTITLKTSAGKCNKVRRVVYANDGVEQMTAEGITQTRCSNCKNIRYKR